MKVNLPRFRTLTDRECRALLRRHHVGRLGFTFRDKVDVEPISYVLNSEWLYARTAPGTKLLQLSHNPWVAFEVDEVTGPFDWGSVVAHGTAYFLTAGGLDESGYDKAVKVLRSIDPRALTHEDLIPERTTLFRIHIDSMTGRAASTAPVAKQRRRKS
jgi:nitroimidazol reductase NimA-like FMN-containing flavoprotein (pyridoxamine 5'-phosphate oxidase superfamily)